jgi:UDP-N-acetylglucosamine transferase subunit ALG13
LIFVTVGTHQQPFQRLLDGLDALDLDQLVVQHGPGTPPAGVARAEAFMPFDRVLAYLDEAEKVITHAGVGSILCARRAGHLPLAIPRRHDLEEHVDEHQAELCAALESRGAVIAVAEVAELPRLLAAAPPRGPGAPAADTGLPQAVGEALQRL